MKSFVFGALLLATAATPVLAQDGPADWSGVYVGGQIGYRWQPKDDGEKFAFDTNRDGAYNEQVATIAQAAIGQNAFTPGYCGGDAFTASPAGGCQSDDDNYDWKLHIGYDRQFGNIVAGVVLEGGDAAISDSVSAFSTTPANYRIRRRLDENANLRLRVGYAFGQSLVYGTGGGSYGKVRNRHLTTNGVNSFTVQQRKDDTFGYNYGGGVEHKLSDRFSIGLLYLFTSLKTEPFIVTAGPSALATPANNPFLRVNPTGTDFKRTGNRFNSQTVNLTASLRF